MFELMFYGTMFSQFDTKAQSEKSYNLKENFENDIQPRFDEVVTDIVQLNNNAGQRSNIVKINNNIDELLLHYKLGLSSLFPPFRLQSDFGVGDCSSPISPLGGVARS